MRMARSILAISREPICRAIAMPAFSGFAEKRFFIYAVRMSMGWRLLSVRKWPAARRKSMSICSMKSIDVFFRQLHFSFDHYSRTTWPGHYKTTQEFFLVLQRKGFIEERTENHLYSEKEKRFLADRYVVGTCPKCGYSEARGDECQRCASSYEAIDLKNPRSKISNTPLVLRPVRIYICASICLKTA